MKRLLLITVVGVLAACLVGSGLLYVPAVNQVVWPPRPTPTPEVFVPGLTATPEEVVRSLGEPPTGFTWQAEHDWDGSIVRMCLVNALEPAGPIAPAVAQAVRAGGPPRGYFWTSEERIAPGNDHYMLVRVCVQRIPCRYGQIPNSRYCRRVDSLP